MAWAGIRGGDALTRSSAFLCALAQVQVDPLVWGGQATPDPRRWPDWRVARPIGGGPMHSPAMASTGRAPASLMTYGSFSGPRYYRPWSAPGGSVVHDAGRARREKPSARSTRTRASWRPRHGAAGCRPDRPKRAFGRLAQPAPARPGPRRRLDRAAPRPDDQTTYGGPGAALTMGLAWMTTVPRRSLLRETVTASGPPSIVAVTRISRLADHWRHREWSGRLRAEVAMTAA